MELVVDELFAGDTGVGTELPQLSACGTVKTKCAEDVEAQPSKSASTNQSTTPLEMTLCSVVASVSPATAAAVPSTAIQWKSMPDAREVELFAGAMSDGAA